MKKWYACLTVLCMATVSLGATAHDTHGFVVDQATHRHAQDVVHARYNPWRIQPAQGNHQQQQFHFHGAGDSLQVRQLPSVVQQTYPLNPLHQRQVEYRDYVYHYNATPYGLGGGMPWWADPVAVPYGPWATGYGWPNGIW